MVETAIQRFEYAVDVDDITITLGWQKFERPVSLVADTEEIHFIMNLDHDFENSEPVDTAVLRGLLEAEFLQNAVFDDVEFDWQELLKMGYVKLRERDITGTEIAEEDDLKEKWPEFREHLTQMETDFHELFYSHAGVISGMIAQELEKQHELSEFLELKRSDVVEAGDRLFD
jgi:hypothetical protein